MTQNMHRFITITGKKWEHNKQLYTQQSSKVLVHLQELDMHHRKARVGEGTRIMSISHGRVRGEEFLKVGA